MQNVFDCMKQGRKVKQAHYSPLKREKSKTLYLFPHLRLATDVQVVSSICNTGFDHRFSVEPVLRRQSGRQEN